MKYSYDNITPDRVSEDGSVCFLTRVRAWAHTCADHPCVYESVHTCCPVEWTLSYGRSAPVCAHARTRVRKHTVSGLLL